MNKSILRVNRAGRTTWSLGIIAGVIILSFQASVFRAQGQWKQIGPAPLTIDPTEGADGQGPDSGEVVDIAIDPSGTTDQIIYIAGNGGIWKTTNGGISWVPTTESLPTLSFGAVALDRGNPSIVYAGTGNLFVGSSGAPNQVAIPRAAGYFGNGVYKSSDGGATWGPLPSNIIPNNKGIDRMVSPASGILLVATNKGLYRVTGGGGAMVQVPVGGIFNTFINDLRLDTVNPSTVYAAQQSGGIFVSTDGGQTFPASSNLFNGINAPTNYGRIVFAQSTQPNNQTIYANVQFTSGTVSAGIFKSTNGGGRWNPIPTATGDIESVNAGYSLTIGVDPQNANRAYIGARSLYRVTDGGASGVNASNRIDLNVVHADQHALVFSPASHFSGVGSTRVYNGTDGGIATNDGQGQSAANWNLINNGIATMLFFQIDIGRGSTNKNAYTYGAAQDLGISQYRPGFAANSWLLGIGGDGGSVAVDPQNPVNALGLAGGYRQSTADGKSWPLLPAGAFPAGASVWSLAFDPNGGVVYGLGVPLPGQNGNPPPPPDNHLYQSTDNGANYTAILNNPAWITATGIVKSDSNTLWLGFSDGTVSRTKHALLGVTFDWASHAIPGSPSGVPVSGIALDPSNTNQAVVVYPFSGTSQRVFLTMDDGINWIDISGNLPSTALPTLPNNGAVNSVVINPNTSPHTLIVATDGGVWQATNWQTANGATIWGAVGGGLPAVQCTSLAMDSDAHPALLRVGTYGRSAFELDYDRQYVNWQAPVGGQDGTREHPFITVRQGLNAPATGGARFINIYGGNYTESQNTINNVTISLPCTLNAINGPVTIH